MNKTTDETSDQGASAGRDLGRDVLDFWRSLQIRLSSGVETPYLHYTTPLSARVCFEALLLCSQAICGQASRAVIKSSRKTDSN